PEVFPRWRFGRLKSGRQAGVPQSREEIARPQPAAAFLLLCAAIYLSPFVLYAYFDRYLVPVTSFLLGFIAVWLTGPEFRAPRLAWSGAFLLVAGYAVFSVGCTDDYLEWNRTRWLAINRLLSQNYIKPHLIDGGVEFNAWWWTQNPAQPTVSFADRPYAVA